MTSDAPNTATLAQAWLHSHEEDTASTTVYRPAKFAFPPSRGRSGFALQTDGTLNARKPGPTDQTEHSGGTWKLDGNELLLSPRGQAAQRMNIDSVAPDKLVVRKL